MPRFLHRFLAVVTTLLLPGCVPSEMPAYTRDGNIVLIANGTLWTCDPQTRTAKLHVLPADPTKNWEPGSTAILLDGKLWVQRMRMFGEKLDRKTGKPIIVEETGQPLPNFETLWMQFDLATDKFIEQGPQFRYDMDIINGPPFVAGWEGKLCLFVETQPYLVNEITGYPKDADSIPHLTAIELTDFTKRHPLPRNDLNGNEIMPAGKGWSVRILLHDPEEPATGVIRSDLWQVRVYDDKGLLRIKIPAPTITGPPPKDQGPAAAMPYTAYSPTLAAVSSDTTVIALIFNGDEPRTGLATRPFVEPKLCFEIFDTRTGALLWQGNGNSQEGLPAVKRDSIWTLDAHQPPAATPKANKIPPSHFLLIAHLLDKATGRDAPKELLNYELGEGNSVGRFAPDPKGDNILVEVNGKKPRLLIVPLREGINPTDVISIDLVDAGLTPQ